MLNPFFAARFSDRSTLTRGVTVVDPHGLTGRIESILDEHDVVVMWETRVRCKVNAMLVVAVPVPFQFSTSDEEHFNRIGIDPDRGVPPYLGGRV